MSFVHTYIELLSVYAGPAGEDPSTAVPEFLVSGSILAAKFNAPTIHSGPETYIFSLAALLL